MLDLAYVSILEKSRGSIFELFLEGPVQMPWTELNTVNYELCSREVWRLNQLLIEFGLAQMFFGLVITQLVITTTLFSVCSFTHPFGVREREPD